MKTAIIDITAAGNNVILAGIPGKRFRVYAYILFSSANNYFIWKSGSTALSGQMHMAASSNAAIHLGDNWPAGGMPVLQTASGEDLVLYMLNAQVGGGHITYGEVAV
jgi:hypothetical protein